MPRTLSLGLRRARLDRPRGRLQLGAYTPTASRPYKCLVLSVIWRPLELMYSFTGRVRRTIDSLIALQN